MSNITLPGYRFATDAQWNSCLFSAADRGSRRTGGGFRPFVPYAQPAMRYETSGGYAPTITCAGELLWRDSTGNLQSLPYGDDKPHALRAPPAIAHAKRLVATANALWAVGEAPDSLRAFDPESLSRRFVLEIPRAQVVDIAGNGRDGLFALIERVQAEREKTWEIVQYDCAGQLKSSFALKDVPDPAEIVYLQSADRLVVLANQRSKLYWLVPDSGLLAFAIGVTMLRPCFIPSALGSDGRARMFVAGSDHEEGGGRPGIIFLDAEGNLLGDMEIEEAVTGVTANRKDLLVTTGRGLLRFAAATLVPRQSSEVRCTLITPMLQSPAHEATRRWLRVEAMAHLPGGSTLEISYAAADDRNVRDQAQRLAEDASIPASRRLLQLHKYLSDWQTISYHGSDTQQDDESVPLSAPLFDVRAPYLWISITLIVSPGGELPSVSEFAVLYPGQTLMDNLPAIYQRVEAQPGSFLRTLVGVLESTTQSLDARIGELGSHIHPNTAPDRWLDFVARWLGLPWDDALSLDQKRRIASRGADIANGRGTRVGLEALLECLMPEKPQRFRVVDSTADFGLAMVGGEMCAGSRLPVILGGLPSSATELGNKAILGQARLPCADNTGPSTRLVGSICVDVSANAEQEAVLKPWLRALISEMVPATVRVQLRWLSGAAFGQGVQLDETLTLKAAPLPRLGTDAVIGIARLPGQRGIALSGSGVDSDIPLY